MSQVRYPGLSPQARQVVLCAYKRAEKAKRKEVYISDYWSALISSPLVMILQSIYLIRGGRKSHREVQVLLPEYMQRFHDSEVKIEHIVLVLLRLQGSLWIMDFIEDCVRKQRANIRRPVGRRVADSRKREWSKLR